MNSSQELSLEFPDRENPQPYCPGWIIPAIGCTIVGGIVSGGDGLLLAITGR